MDWFVMAVLVLAFAVLVTAHVTIALGLLGRTPRQRAVWALLLPPLAPYWAHEQGMRVRALAWVLALIVYALARIVAQL